MSDIRMKLLRWSTLAHEESEDCFFESLDPAERPARKDYFRRVSGEWLELANFLSDEKLAAILEDR